jgi:mRNA interferase YafQ
LLYKKGLESLASIIINTKNFRPKLLQDEPLDPHYNDHALVNRKPERDLHIKPDWLLIYKYDGEFVRFIDTGSHSDLFN